ncbi:MAG: NADH-quinone oxidoreductase subunit NuoF [Acidobacteria bacterium]|nr:NADH-quinone oxidoreductase subunit NuoF [Acidobacteriota bacterium]
MQFSLQLEDKFRTLLSRYPVRRSALVPMLLFAQDECGFLNKEVVAEIARRLGLTVLDVEGVISYYSMLRKKPAGRHHLQICTNISCLLRGANDLFQHAQKKLGIGPGETTPDGLFSLEEVECIGACSWAPALQANYDYYHEVTPQRFDRLLAELEAGRVAPDKPAISHSEHEVRVLSRRFDLPNSASIDTYLAHDGYRALEKALRQMTPDEVIDQVKQSNLRGRGGAGFPAGMKWSFVPKQSSKPKYIVCNADESEPGTCKDRLLMQNDPHQMMEGIVLAGVAVGAHQGYIYVRGEYRYLIEILDRAIEEAYARGYLGKNILGTGFDFDLATHTGAGAYECGEESALLESLEGKRGIPRIRPPFPAVVGLYGGPTVLNNVETFCSVPSIILNGGPWYASLGTPRNGGTRLFVLSGHVHRPGVYELPMGFPLRKMIEEVGGGIAGGKKFKAVIPGGSSTPVLTGEALDTPMDFDSVAKAGSMLGSGAVIVMHEDTCMVQAALRIMQFYAHESCGWCTPCREGTSWLAKTLDRVHSGGGRREDIRLIEELAKNMLGKTFCPLGDAAAMPTISIVQKFRDEFEQHLGGQPCPLEGRRKSELVSE